MASITPSDIVDFIDNSFPNATKSQKLGNIPEYSITNANIISGLVRLLDQLDPALIPAGKDFVAMVSARAAMADTVQTWVSRGGSTTLHNLKAYGKDPILIVREVLERCPDLSIPEEIAGLEFIEDSEMRQNLRFDLSIVERLMYAEHWKPAMVMGGSISEALLLDALLKCDPHSLKASAAKQQIKTKEDPKEWYLPQLANVAFDLKIISEDCLKLVKIAQNYRNLIHPGKELRLRQKVTRSAALLCQSALQKIIEELLLV